MNRCEYCDSKFKNIDELSDHLYNIDHEETRYICPYNECNHIYRQKSGIIRHLGRYHQTYIDVEPTTVIIRPAGKNMTLKQ